MEGRAFVLDTFAMSKSVYRAQIIPIPDRWVKKFEGTSTVSVEG